MRHTGPIGIAQKLVAHIVRGFQRTDAPHIAGRIARTLIRTFAPGLAGTRPKSLGMFEFAGSWQGAYLLSRGLFLPSELAQIVGPELAREGLRRLQPLRRIASTLSPDPGSDMGRVCALESANYMRNQLLRDADWAGMAHSLEIRVPLVDATLVGSLASSIGGLTPAAGKAALASAPSQPLPDEVVTRRKTGFGVPTRTWMATAAGLKAPASEGGERKGLVSRRWSRVVLDTFSAAAQAPAR